VEVRTELASRPSVKGEITLLIGKTDEVQADDTPLEEAVRAAERQGLARMEAIKQVARQRGLSKREVYRLIAGD
jgi:16S rRNA (cytidine1402-2'-O)-methyltransferase